MSPRTAYRLAVVIGICAVAVAQDLGDRALEALFDACERELARMRR